MMKDMFLRSRNRYHAYGIGVGVDGGVTDVACLSAF